MPYPNISSIPSLAFCLVFRNKAISFHLSLVMVLFVAVAHFVEGGRDGVKNTMHNLVSDGTSAELLSSVVMTYVLMMARMNVPHGKLQLLSRLLAVSPVRLLVSVASLFV